MDGHIMRVSDTPYRVDEIMTAEKPTFFGHTIEYLLRFLTPFQLSALEKNGELYVEARAFRYRLRDSMMGIWVEML
jgi:hypothetical protein